MPDFKFIDLFAGIGGFHQALEHLGGQCVYAAEIDKNCIGVYKQNYGIDADHDLVGVDPNSIPKGFDVLCAGFPCQPFSKAGYQKGFSDTRGTLFFEIEKILKSHKPKYILLENVRNLASHDGGNTWKVIKHSLIQLGYRIPEKPLILSPHYFGIPQLRERVVIPGILEPESALEPLQLDLPRFQSKKENDAYSILDSDEAAKEDGITAYEEMVLSAWDEFYQGIDKKVIGFPVWASVFLEKPSIDGLPQWKVDFINKNLALYAENKKYIDSWLKKYNYLVDFVPTHRKFEWQAGENISSIWEGIIQFRPSGIRVKVPDCFPALVAMVQTPIIGKLKRRLTVKEAGRLQSFDDSFEPDTDKAAAYKQFGNAVNVKVIETVAKELFKERSCQP